MLHYKLITEQSEFVKVSKLEEIIWGMTGEDVVSSHILQAIIHAGGCLIGGYDGAKLVGFTLGMAMRGETRLWSHMAGVHPDYQRQGIGFNLKQTQREWALENGYTHISWTFDPLMAANAHFNFHLLGTTCRTYHVNFYGEMTDSINRGLPSDRFEVLWDLSKPENTNENIPDGAPFLLRVENDQPVTASNLAENWHFVEIPVNFTKLKSSNKALAIHWKETFRGVIQSAFEHGYQVIDFFRQNNQNWYVLCKID